jgi:hypothetical protein
MTKKREKRKPAETSRKRPRLDVDARGKKIYLVSGDLRHLFKIWADGKGYETPANKTFRRLRKIFLRKLQSVLGPDIKVVYLPWADVTTRVLRLVRSKLNGLPVVSLDPVYVIEGVDASFGATRIMHHENNAWQNIGYGPRRAERSIYTQLKAVELRAAEVKKQEVILADDGVWSGGSIAALEHSLASLDVKVKQVVVAINVLPGEEEPDITNKVRAPIVSAWEPIKRNLVADWVCERDFFIGIPYGGRTAGNLSFEVQKKKPEDKTIVEKNYPAVPMQGNFAAPYLSFFGDPVHWASIPKAKAVEFSIFCLQLARRLYEECQRCNLHIGEKREILVGDLSRIPYAYRTVLDWTVLRMIDDAIQRLRV